MNMKKRKDFFAMEKYNGVSLISYIVICIALLLAYLIELIKGNRTFGYFLIFSIIVLVPLIACIISYLKNKSTNLVKYIFSIGYSLLYAFVIMTANTNVTFVYIILLIILLTQYADFKLSLFVNLYAVLMNIVQVIYMANTTGLSKTDIVNAEIQIIVIFLVGVFAVLTTISTEQVNIYKLKELDDEKENISALLNKNMEISNGIVGDIEHVISRMKILDESVANTRNSMEDVCEGSTETADSVQNQLIKTEEIQKHISIVQQVGLNISNDMNKTENAIGIGKDNIHNLIVQVDSSEKASEMVAGKIDELGGNTEKMHSIVELINSVTKQTSLLSLNASIEAARAGEAGKGFAVVASEISTLAKQTSDATVNITQLINTISQSLGDVISAINKLIDGNKVQNKVAHETAKNFENIETNSQNIYTITGDLSKVIDNLSEANASIVLSIQNISSITEEVSARATETYNGSEINSVIVSEVINFVDKLNKRIHELNK